MKDALLVLVMLVHCSTQPEQRSPVGSNMVCAWDIATSSKACAHSVAMIVDFGVSDALKK